MIFTPEHITCKNDQYTFGAQVTAKAHACLDKDVLKKLWHGSTCRASNLTIEPVDDLIFTIGTAKPIQTDNAMYQTILKKNIEF